jgi:aerobic-type carbon monoxide dehydrogenase small subunit (CoxS/CutS family)
MEIPLEVLAAEQRRLAELRERLFSELCECTGALRQVEAIMAWKPEGENA